MAFAAAAMRLTPYERVDDVGFATTRDQLVERLGRPPERRRNAVGLDEFDYLERVFRFQDGGRLEEVTRRAPVLHLDGIAVPFPSLQGFVGSHDGDAFERGGFVVSPRFGIVFVPSSPDWVTAIARHAVDAWRAL